MADEDAVEWFEVDAFHPPEIPESLGIDPLLAALVATVLFLELSGEQTVQPDEATTAEEAIGFYLQRLSPTQVVAVAEQLGRLATYARANGWSDDAVEVIENFLRAAGLEGDDQDSAS